jgi:hypothetical protein
MNKQTYYKMLFALLLKEVPSMEMIEEYINSPHVAPDNLLELTDWCAKHAKYDWMTGISIIDAVDDMYKDAAAEGNIK